MSWELLCVYVQLWTKTAFQNMQWKCVVANNTI